MPEEGPSLVRLFSMATEEAAEAEVWKSTTIETINMRDMNTTKEEAEGEVEARRKGDLGKCEEGEVAEVEAGRLK